MEFSCTLLSIELDLDEYTSDMVSILRGLGIAAAGDFSLIRDGALDVADNFFVIDEIGTLDVAALDDMIITCEVDPLFELPWVMGI